MQCKTPDGNVMVSGTLGSDAEYKRIGESGIDLVDFSLAIGKRDNGNGGNDTIWVKVNCWRRMAPQAVGLKKGDMAMVVGQPGSRTYTGKDGLEHRQAYVNAELVIPVPKKTDLPMMQQEPPATPPVQQQQNFEEEEFNGDLPF